MGRDGHSFVSADVGLLFHLLDIEPEASQHYSDCDDAYAKPDTALVALNHRVFTGLLVLGGDFQACLNVLIHQSSLEAMYRDSSFRQRILRLILCEPGLAHFHARGLGDTKSLVGILDGPVQLNQATLYCCPRLIALVAWLMTAHADALRTRAKHRVRWKMNGMIRVTDNASRERDGLKRLVVRTLLVHLGLECVTVRAHILNLIYSWWHRAMVSMTRRTGWRTEITSHN